MRAANWDGVLARHSALKETSTKALKTLDPAYPDWLPVSVPPGARAGQAIDALLEDLNSFSDACWAWPGKWKPTPLTKALRRAPRRHDEGF